MNAGWHHRVIGAASRLVPLERRSEWRREWDAELRHFEKQLDSRTSVGTRRSRLFYRSLGALPDACYLLAVGPVAERSSFGTSVASGARAMRIALVACVVVMMFGAVVVQFMDGINEGGWPVWSFKTTATVVLVGSMAFAVGAGVFCFPVLILLSRLKWTPGPKASAVLAACLCALPSLVFLGRMFDRPVTMTEAVGYMVRHFGETLLWSLPFATPGAVLGFVWSTSLQRGEHRPSDDAVC